MGNEERKFWRCCGHQIRTNFCPNCGATRPSDTITVEAEMLLDEFIGEIQRYKKSAATLIEKAELPESKIKDLCGNCRYDSLIGLAIGFEKRALKLERWANTLKNLIDLKLGSKI